jgi:hypothetical protein
MEVIFSALHPPPRDKRPEKTYILDKRQTMTERAILLKEIEALPLEYLHEVADFAGYLRQKKQRHTVSLEKAAQMAVDEYRAGKELTAFSSLDGEDFHETR